MDFMKRLDEVHCLAIPCLHLVDNISRMAYSITLPSHVYQHCASQLRHCLGELDFYLSPTIFTENPEEVAEVIVYNSEVRGWINRLKLEYERLTILSRAGSRKKEFDHRVGECLKLLTVEDSAARLKEVIIKDLESSKKIDPYHRYTYSSLEPLFEEMGYVSTHYTHVLASRLRQTVSPTSKSKVEEVAGDAGSGAQEFEQHCGDDVAIGVDEGHSLITGVMTDSILPVADNYAAAKENPMYNAGKEWK